MPAGEWGTHRRIPSPTAVRLKKRGRSNRQRDCGNRLRPVTWGDGLAVESERATPFCHAVGADPAAQGCVAIAGRGRGVPRGRMCRQTKAQRRRAAAPGRCRSLGGTGSRTAAGATAREDRATGGEAETAPMLAEAPAAPPRRVSGAEMGHRAPAWPSEATLPSRRVAHGARRPPALAAQR